MIKSSDEKGEANKNVNDVTTFPVPFLFGEIKEDISITTTNVSPQKLSKIEIIENAFQAHLQGKIGQAVQYYQLFINLSKEDT